MTIVKKILIMIISVLTMQVYSQTGSISGKIIDAVNNETLPGVNVILKGTYYGSATDINGAYRIAGISAGTYTVEVSFIGYKTVQYTGIKILAGENLVIDVKLEESVLTLGQDVVVVGDKPLIDVEETQSKKSVSREDIDVLIVENIGDIISQQAGVVKDDNSLHIRGGRAYENAFLLDGVSVQDPLAGTGFGLQLSANALEEVEVITGGFNAEYGQATSGIVNARTREGNVNKFSGQISYKTDNILPSTSFHNFNIDIFEANLSGPEPLTMILLPALGLKIPGELSFFGNIFVGLSDGIIQGYYKPEKRSIYSSTFGGTRFSPKFENSWFWLGKLTYKPQPTFKIGYSYNQSVNVNQNSQSLQSNLEYIEPSPGYQYEFQNILNQANVFTHQSIYHSLAITHTLNTKTFYELKFNTFFTNLRSDANGLPWNEYRQPKDFPNFPVEYYNTNRDTVGIIPGDGFWDVGNPYTWHDHYLQEFSIIGDITSFFDEKNKFKAGFKFQFQEMQVVDIYQPWVGTLGLNNDIYKVYPALGAFYLQDNINFGGMILNFGLRYDFWFPGKYVDDAIDNPDVVTIPDENRQRYKDDSFKWFDNRYFKARLSPRLGISHPITDNQTLFFSYGHFSKWPKPQFVYAKLDPYNAQSSFQRFGNPNLKPETTVAYEIGVKTQFSENDVLTITAYYKDIFDYVNTRSARISSARFATQRFITYVNSDYARSRGIEFEYRKRIGRWFNASAYVSFSEVTGKSSSADEGVLIAAGTLDESIREQYVPWDRPIQANLFANFYVAPNEALFGFANGILDDYNLSIRAFFQSGKRYTPANFTGNFEVDGRPEYETSRTERNSRLADPWFYVDLNFEKYIKIGGMRFSVFVEINNVFDRQNSAIINPATGRAYEYGDPTPNSWNDPLYPDLQAPLNPYPYNPARYLSRRNIKVGLSFRF